MNSDIKKRRRIAKIYYDNINCSDLLLPSENKKNFHAYYVFVVRHKKRGEIMNYLKKNGIFCNISYPFPIHNMRGYKNQFHRVKDLKITEKLSKEIFSLPMYPELNDKKLEKVINIINKF